MSSTPSKPRERRINWLNVSTVGSAAVLIAAEVFGGAFAAGWAFANLFSLGEYGVHILQALFFARALHRLSSAYSRCVTCEEILNAPVIHMTGWRSAWPQTKSC